MDERRRLASLSAVHLLNDLDAIARSVPILYLTGGIALRLSGLLQESRFMQTFGRRGRFTRLMERVPVHVITTRAALIGAAAFGLETLETAFVITQAASAARIAAWSALSAAA